MEAAHSKERSKREKEVVQILILQSKVSIKMFSKSFIVLMKVTINDERVILNNFPDENPIDWLTNLTEEQKTSFSTNEPFIQNFLMFTLDQYDLPSILIKAIKSMKKMEYCEFITTKIDKLLTNFSNAQLDQYQLFSEGVTKVSF